MYNDDLVERVNNVSSKEDHTDYRVLYAHVRDPKYREVVDELVNEFFADDHYFLAGNFIDEANFRTRLTKNDVSDTLLRAVVAYALSSRHEDQQLLRWWFDKLHLDILSNVGELTMDFFQTILLVLVNFYSYTNKRTFFLLPILVRMAYSLLLNQQTKVIRTPVETELRNRMMWNCFVLDKELAGGIKEFSLIEDSSINIPYPQDSLSDLTPSSGILAFSMKVQRLRNKVLMYTKSAAKNMDHWWKEGSQFWEYEKQLRALTATLPPDLQFDAANLSARPTFSASQYFLRTHLQAYHVFCDLYRVSLPGLKESSPQILLDMVPRETLSHFRKECIATSVMIARTIKENLLYLNSRELNLWTLRFLSECTRLFISAAHHNLYDLLNMTLDELGALIESCLSMMYNYSEQTDHCTLHRETIGYLVRGCIQCDLKEYVPQKCMVFSTSSAYEDNDGNKPALILSAHHPLSAVPEISQANSANSPTQEAMYFLPQFSFYDFDDINSLLYQTPLEFSSQPDQ